MKYLILLACLLATPLSAQTYLDRLHSLFDAGSLPSLEEFKTTQVWTGRCVNSRLPDQFFDAPAFPQALLTIDVSGDNIVGYRKRIRSQTSSRDPRGEALHFKNFLTRQADFYETPYESKEWKSIVQWAGLRLKNAMTAYLLIRKARTDSGDALVVRSVCASKQGCYFYPGYKPEINFRNDGEAWGYCYYTSKVYEEGLPSDPTHPPPPPSLD
jgi:hypothetical protein